MNSVFENIKSLAPTTIILWSLLIFLTIKRPQKYYNSIILSAACFFTLFFLAGLFGEYSGIAIIVVFFLILLGLLMVPVMLVINGIVMIKKESLSFSHMLSLLLGIVIGTGEVLSGVGVSLAGDVAILRNMGIAAMLFSLTVFYFSCLLLNFVLYSVLLQFIPHKADFNYIIIHGCGLISGEKVSKLLSNRINKAIEVFNRCENKPYLIASGGKGSDEKISEAEAISDYLVEKGIDKKYIILEDKSTTTMENLRYSNIIIKRDETPDAKVALISSNYHIYRCLSYAKTLKMKCVGIGAKVALYYWPTALIREFVALFKKKSFLFWSVFGYLLFMTVPVIFILF